MTAEGRPRVTHCAAHTMVLTFLVALVLFAGGGVSGSETGSMNPLARMAVGGWRCNTRAHPQKHMYTHTQTHIHTHTYKRARTQFHTKQKNLRNNASSVFIAASSCVHDDVVPQREKLPVFSTRLLPGTLFLGTRHGEETRGSESLGLSRLSPEQRLALEQAGAGGAYAVGEKWDSRGTVSLSPKKKCHSLTSLSWKARTDTQNTRVSIYT